jgi:hypothetical protein
VFLGRVLQSLVTANIPSELIPVTLMMEALCSSEMPVLIRGTRCNIQEDAILRSHRREDLKSCKVLTMVCNTQNYWVSGLSPSSGILYTRKYVSEAEFASILGLWRKKFMCKYLGLSFQCANRAGGRHTIGLTIIQPFLYTGVTVFSSV